MSFRAGDRVGEYTILGALGRGGMGQVFRVEHSITKRIEAMKVLMAEGFDGEDSAARFLREVKIHASLNHPNIVTLHNAFQAGDQLALVMELVEGRSLRNLMNEGRLALPFGVNCILQVLAGLSYAHQSNIIHRDISPSNIIVTENGQAKLMDFGLSKALGAEPGLGQSGVVLGTVYYCSPEQVKGQVKLDPRTDIYSLGTVLYEVVAGRRPFESDTAFSIMLDHVEHAPIPPIEVDPAIPRALSDIVLKAMAKDPRDRFQSADEFRQSLDRVLGSLGRNLATQRIPKVPFWQTVANGCVRLSGLRAVQVGFVAAGLAFPATVVLVHAVGYSAPTPRPPLVLAYPRPPVDALELPAPAGTDRVASKPVASEPPQPAPVHRTPLLRSVAKSVTVNAKPSKEVNEEKSTEADDKASAADDDKANSIATDRGNSAMDQKDDSPAAEPEQTPAKAVSSDGAAESEATKNADTQPNANGIHRVFKRLFHLKRKSEQATSGK